jgi:four helix bundle protein
VEAEELRVWLEFALAHQYITNEFFEQLFDKCANIISMLVKI